MHADSREKSLLFFLLAKESLKPAVSKVYKGGTILAATLKLTDNYRYFPGYLRIAVEGMKRNPGFASYLCCELQKHKGIRTATANPLTGRALVQFDTDAFSLMELRSLIADIGNDYRPQPVKNILRSTESEDMQKTTRQHAVFAVATGGILAALAAKRAVVGRGALAASPQVFNLAAFLTIISGYPVLRSGVKALIWDKRINHDLALFIATLTLLALRESLVGLSVMWVVHLTNLFRYSMQNRARRNVQKLLGGKQQTVLRLTAKERSRALCSELAAGDIVVIHAGEMIPADGTIIGGKATVSQAAVSGNCQPELRLPGEAVCAGSQVQAGSVKVAVTKASGETAIGRIGQLVSSAQTRELNQDYKEEYVGKLMWLVLAIAGGVYFFSRDALRSLAVLLAGCPATISLARDSALGASVAAAAGRGILVQKLEAFELAGQADTVLFDKTGTLTAASPQIAEVYALVPSYDADAILSLAASAEKSTCHPLARMLVKEAALRKLSIKPASGRSVVGFGVQAVVEKQTVLVGNRLLMEKEKVPLFRSAAKAREFEQCGSSVVYVAVNRRLIGLIGVCDTLRPESYQSIHELRSLGIRDIGVITGDAAFSAKHIADELGLNAHWTSMLPEAKQKLVRQLKQDGRQVVMVGDGTNDSPALAASQVGIAMGLSGTREAIATADIVLAEDDPGKVADTIALSRNTGEVVRQNVALAVGFNVTGVALAAAGLISPFAAGMLLNVSTLAVIFNSARLLPKRRRTPPQILNLQQFAMPEKAVKLSRKVPGCEVPKAGQANAEWQAKSWEDICSQLNTSVERGLTSREAAERLGQYGPNLLQEAPKPSFWKLLGQQFKDFMVQILLGAAGLSFALGKTKDALLTVGIVAANALLGVIQERKASSSLEALKKLSAPQARIIRGGRTGKVAAEGLVPGDIVVLEAGDRVPADVRLIAASHFEVEEAALTGEPLPVRKDAAAKYNGECPLGDRRNMVFMGTNVTRGRALAVVVASGMSTEMGRIASLIQVNEEEATPLQRRLEELGRYLVYGCLGVSALVFLIGLLRGERLLYMLQTAASLAVAAIPEGLTAIVIIALAMGVQRMSKRNIIVRKLSSIETLGSANVICSDKTGTLTQNKMTVREIFTGGKCWQVTGEGYAPYGEFLLNGEACGQSPELIMTLRSGALCNNAKLFSKQPAHEKVVELPSQAADDWKIEGDPTEAAIVVAAAKAGFNAKMLAKTFRRLKEYPFESERRMMSVVCEKNNEKTKAVYCKGAVDKILAVCTHYFHNGQILPLDRETRTDIEQANTEMAGRALRVLAAAYREIDSFEGSEESQNVETDFIFCGLIGMIDPPRPEVPEAIAKCKAAGVKVVMITGDHPLTARAIACELGLIGPEGKVLLGSELDKLSDEELAALAVDAQVYARTSPYQKLRIVKALKQKGYIVAMTGDGVNDAPAVKAADIGIAMGKMGTDVTKQAACMTLADDNFATIVRAMEEGRSIYANIRKAIRYLVATNIGEVILMLLAALVGLPLPLIPIQLLWINLIGDGLPAVALVNDPAARNIMEQAPKTAKESVFSDNLGRKVISRGLVIGVASVALFAWKLGRTGNLILARSLLIAQLAISQFVHIFDCRLERETGSVGLLSNPWLVAAVLLSMGMVAGILHIPALQTIFGTTALSGADWLVAAVLAGVTSIADFGLVRTFSPAKESV